MSFWGLFSMKKLICISALLLFSTFFLSAAEKQPEITISTKNCAKLSLWYRIKYAIDRRLELAFNTEKKLKNIIKDGNVVVKFYRPGCKYCLYIDPILDAVKNKYAQDITFVYVNLNAQSLDYKKEYSFEFVPTIVYFKHGKEVLRHGSENGTITQEDIEKNIKMVFEH